MIKAGHHLVEVGEQGHVTWRGEIIGRVHKGTRTYSPPTRSGSRIAKYHKEVPCWYAERPGEPQGYRVPYDTRRSAILSLIRHATGE